MAERIRQETQRRLGSSEVPDRKSPQGFLPYLTLGKFDPAQTNRVQTAVGNAQYPRQKRFRLDRFQVMSSRRESGDVTVYQPAGAEAILDLSKGTAAS